MTPERHEHASTSIARLDPDAAAAAVRAALVDVDPGAAFPVGWWSQVPGRGWFASRRNRDDAGEIDDPHTSVTSAELRAEIDAARARVTPKGSGDALCGGAFRVTVDAPGAAVFRRTVERLAGVSLVEIDVDGTVGGAALGAVSLAHAVEAFTSLGVAAIAHPSPSSTVADGAAGRFRVWARVAVPGLSYAPAHHDPRDLDHAVNCTCAALAAAALQGANVDRQTWHGNALGYVNASHSASRGGVLEAAGKAVDPYAVRDALVAAGAVAPYQRGVKGTRNGEALLTLHRELSALVPGALGRHTGRGVYAVACPLAHEHSDPTTGTGRDTSCVLRTTEGLWHCSHNHNGAGPLTGRAMVAAWAQRLPSFAPRAWALWSEATTRAGVDVRVEAFAGAPGDTSDPRVTWDAAPDGGAVRAYPDPDTAAADIVDDVRAVLTRWEGGDRTVRLRCDATGTGKSTVTAAALVALAPPLPGETDNRQDSPRPIGVYVVETIAAVHAAVKRIDDAGAGRGPELGDMVTAHVGGDGLVPLRRGRHGAVLRGAGFLPVSAVGEDGRDARRGKGDGEGLPRACPHWRTARAMEAAGVDVRTSLCRCAGTDDPAELRRNGATRATPCPRSRHAGGECVAEDAFHYADGSVPRSGDPWVAVASGAAAHAIPDAMRGALHIVDETDRATATKPFTVLPANVAVDAPAVLLVDVLPADKTGAAQRKAEAVRGVYAGLLAWLRESGPGVLFDGPETSEGRIAHAVEVLDVWCTRGTAPGRADRHARTAMLAWASLAHDGDDDDRAAYVRAALMLWRRARPMISRWRRATWRGDDPAIAANVWHALAAYFDGATVTVHTTDDPHAPDDPGARVRSGGVTVHPWPAPLVCARRWIEHGPVLCLDATADASLVASALAAGDPASLVSSVRACASQLAPRATVRRTMVTTSRATRRAMLRSRSVRWEHREGAAAAALVGAALAVLQRDAPRDEGGALAPGVFVAPRPVSLAVRAQYEGTDPSAMLDDDGEPFDDDTAARVRAAVEAAPARLRAAVEAFRAQCPRVWWTWQNGVTARGSNDPHNGGARWVVTIGDGFVPPEASELRAKLARRHGDDGATAQQRRDAAAALAQAHGRVRIAHVTGPVLLLHIGTVRPMDWPPAATSVVTMDALRAQFSQRAAAPAAPAQTPTARVHTPRVPELARALDAGWSQTAIMRALAAQGMSVAYRTVLRWCGNATTPSAEHMAALARALDAADGVTRAAYRELLLPGRRATDLVNGKGGVCGVLALSAAIAGDNARAAERAAQRGDAPPTAPTMRALTPRDLDGDRLLAWVEGRAALAGDVVATLAAVSARMTAAWGRKPDGFFARQGHSPGVARAVDVMAVRRSLDIVRARFVVPAASEQRAPTADDAQRAG